MMNCDDEDARQGVLETARPFRFKRLKNSAKKVQKKCDFFAKKFGGVKSCPEICSVNNESLQGQADPLK